MPAKKKTVKKQAAQAKVKVKVNPKATTKPKEELKKPSVLASVLVIISAVLLMIQGLLSALFLFFRNDIILEIERQGLELPETIQTTITIMGLFGIAWIILSLLMFLANAKIRKAFDKSWMWFLFVLSILVLFTGAGIYITGIIALIGSVIYIIQKNKS